MGVVFHVINLWLQNLWFKYATKSVVKDLRSLLIPFAMSLDSLTLYLLTNMLELQ